MTKRLVIAFLFLLLSFLVSFFSVSFVINEIDKTIETIDSISDERLCAQEILSMWQENKKYFPLFLKHTDADSIERYYLELEAALKDDDADEIGKILYRLRAFLSVTAEGEKIKSENIF